MMMLVMVLSNFSALTVIAESPLDKNLIYTGADDGTGQMTRDGGQHWTNITANVHDLPPMLEISGIVASKYAAGRAYLTVDGHFNDDYRAYVFASEDYGQTWHAITGGLPQTSVHRIREHPSKADLLVIGTETGVYATFDSWRTLDSRLEHRPAVQSPFTICCFRSAPMRWSSALTAAESGCSITPSLSLSSPPKSAAANSCSRFRRFIIRV